MLRALKSLFDDQPTQALPGHERRHLQVAVASLLHEAARVDLAQAADERAAAEHALTDLFGLPAAESANLLVEGGDRAKHLTSYFAPGGYSPHAPRGRFGHLKRPLGDS